jgi:hypothetical protein
MEHAAGDTFDEKLAYLVDRLSAAFLASKGIDPTAKAEEPTKGESNGRTDQASNSTGN